MEVVFDISILILGKLMWACPNLLLIEIATASKRNSSFLIISVTYYEHNDEKMKSNSNA